ncbi:MAG: hypothetical protein GX622_08445 [Bacteroidales bacterium]|nr:hypothetical protein [Bacteroidales bacterium]
MRRAKYIICMFLMVHAISLAGQSRSDLREMFISAEGDVLFEDYTEALPKYLSLLQIFPDNFNLYYRIGQCYLNTPGEKDQAIPWLQTAADNINTGYRAGKLREKGAPYDALYLLANAYRIAEEFDKALDTYQLFLKDVDTEKYDTALVRFQMQTCNNARVMMRKPVFVVDKNMGNTINDRFSEYNPVISADENTLLFTRELQFYDAIFWSRKEDGRWTDPVNLTPQLGVDQDYYTSSLSPDGRTLLMYRVDTYDGNIYMSHLEGETWSTVEKLNGHINTKYWESHATMSSDGKKIFFTSNRKESLGGLDIFMSVRDSSGNWGPAMNLGPEINTVYNEQTPFLANNDRTLFFSSRGHFNIGGYDIFRSDLDDNGNWSTPVNVGYPLNTPDDDLFFTPVGIGNRGYFGKFSNDGYGRMDLYSCDIYSDLNPRNFIVTGKASVNNLVSEFLQPVKITASSNSDNGNIIHALTNPVTGLYTFMLPHGGYSISYDSDDAVTVSQDIELPPDRSGDTVHIQPVILKETDYSAYLRLLSDTMLNVVSHDPVTIDLIAEERSLLDIEVITPDSTVTAEQYRITDTTFAYTFSPATGDSKVSLRLTDRFGNDTGAVVMVHRSDVPARRQKPLYHEIPVRPGADKVAPPVSEEGTSAGDTSPDMESDPVTQTKATADNPADSDQVGDTMADGKENGKCRYWWLLLAAGLLLLFFLLWRRKKRRKNDDEQ